MPVKATTRTLPAHTGEETPSERIIRESRPKLTIKDSNGRTIVFRRLSIMDQAKFYRTIGAAHSSNEPYMRLMNVAAMVVSIDGDIGPQPTSLSFAEMRMDWLGDGGFIACVNELTREADEMTEDAKEASQKYRDDVKN